MGKIIDFDNISGDSLCQQLVKEMESQKHDDIETNFASPKEIKRYYDFLYSKIIYALELQTFSPILQKKTLEVLDSMNELGVDNNFKLSMMATWIALISNNVHPDLEYLNLNESLLLSVAMRPVPLNDYSSYGYILASPTILKKIISKTDDRNQQLDMCDKIFDHCDEFVHNRMKPQQLEASVSCCLKIISQYKVRDSENIKKKH